MAGLGILHRSGEREAAISMARRALAVTDDPEVRARYEAILTKQMSERLLARRERRNETLAEAWKTTPSVSKTMLNVLTPPRQPEQCAGQLENDRAACASTWVDWVERIDAVNERELPGDESSDSEVPPR